MIRPILTAHVLASRSLNPVLAFKKPVMGKYQALRRRANRDSGLFRMRHPCLARRATLKALRLLKPIPPIQFAGSQLRKEVCALVAFPQGVVNGTLALSGKKVTDDVHLIGKVVTMLTPSCTN